MQHYMKDLNRIYIYGMPVLDSRMYIVINDKNEKEALIIDPLCDTDAESLIRELEHATILLTHSHYDHISGVNWVRKLMDCTLYCSELCAKKIQDPCKNLAAFAAALVIGKSEEEQEQCLASSDLNFSCQADKTFEKEISFDFGSYRVDIIHTPGHSDCSQCIQLKTDKKGLTPIIVFTGDSLVNGHEVITRLPSGSKKDYNTITKPYLDSLADDVMIMPGHGDWGLLRKLR